ncbi:hypothetical protein V8E54_004529 [Elaphomyces granulatus]
MTDGLKAARNDEEWNGFDDDSVNPSAPITLNSSPSLGAQLAPPPCGIYESVEVAIREMNLWAAPLGYAVIKGRTKYRKYKSLQKAWIICDRGKKSRLLVAAADSKRPNRGTKKTECPFSITLLETDGKGCGSWAVTRTLDATLADRESIHLTSRPYHGQSTW